MDSASFERRVDRGDGPDCCHYWVGYKDRSGIGHWEDMTAHRFAWVLERGPVPDGMEVGRRCLQPACVNVRHMELRPELTGLKESKPSRKAKRGMIAERVAQAKWDRLDKAENMKRKYGDPKFKAPPPPPLPPKKPTSFVPPSKYEERNG